MHFALPSIRRSSKSLFNSTPSLLFNKCALCCMCHTAGVLDSCCFSAAPQFMSLVLFWGGSASIANPRHMRQTSCQLLNTKQLSTPCCAALILAWPSIDVGYKLNCHFNSATFLSQLLPTTSHVARGVHASRSCCGSGGWASVLR